MRGGLFHQGDATFPRYARVVLERGIDHPEGLTYGVPESIGPLAVGDRVEAPLGKSDAPAAGYVFEVTAVPGLDPSKIKPIRRRTGVRLPATIVRLAEWVARYYCTPLGMTLAAMAPAAVKQGVGSRRVVEIELTGAPPPARLTPAVADALRALVALPPASFPITAKAAALAAGLRTVAPINRLLRLGLVREVERIAIRAAWDDRPIPSDVRVEPTPAQREAIEAVSASLGSFRVHLLRGVTGSGKTEVYLRALEAALRRGERAIVLVPEISLTPQTVGRFLARFRAFEDGGGGRGVGIAVLHSGLTAAQRSQQWSAAASGAARIVIGARSAIFAPFPEVSEATGVSGGGGGAGRLGLIIVDEEHEDGYKQDQLPRYHARDVAIKRAQLESCPVLLGSATPSLESWRAASEGRYTLLELPDRVGGARLPRVEIVDLAEQRRARPWTDQRVHLLGPRLEREIGAALDGGGQVILLLNRRGWGNYICCPDHRCGWVLSCESCDAAMVYHRERLTPGGGVVRCHHCLAERLLPGLCPLCGRKATVFGMGTQRVEDELTRLFPGLIGGETMLRMDGDTVGAGAGRAWFEALDRFAKGEIRVLLGTQMIAKGLDFPGVRLVGVVNADTALSLPDFRAGERTFQLVSQVAGRTGRPGAKDPGLVIVQTFVPRAAPIRLAASHDYRAFAAEELDIRRRAGLPPFARMARIVVRDRQEPKAWAHAQEVEAALLDAMGADHDVRLRGPMPCPIARINDYHRIALELTARTPVGVQKALTHARNRGLLKSDARTAVDVDPTALL